MNGMEFLNLAGTLVSRTDEGAVRSVISRAYYGAFIYAKFTLIRLGLTGLENENNHGLIWRLFQNSGNGTLQKAAIDLNNLRKNRNDADYVMKNGRHTSSINAQLDLKTANTLVQTFQQCITSPDKSNFLPKILHQYDVERGKKSAITTPPKV